MLKDRLKRALSQFSGKTVLVLGDLMLDEYIWGEVNRISPEAPIPVVEVTEVTIAPGGACNVAANITELGGNVILVGLVGKDGNARRLKGALAKLKVSSDFIVEDPSRPTTLKTRIVAHNQQVVRADRESRKPIDESVAGQILSAVRGLLPTCDCMVISDYAKGMTVPSLIQDVISIARSIDRPVAIDPKGTDYSKFRRGTVITPNKGEAARAAKMDIADTQSLVSAGRSLLRELACEAVLITRGEEGMSLFEANDGQTHLPTFAQQVYDVTGAGDTVISTLSLALTTGATLVECATLANHAAGLVVGKIGTATVTQEELRAELEKDDLVWREDEMKIS